MNVTIALLLLISENLCANSPLFLTTSPQVTSRCKGLPNLILMHLFVSLNLAPFGLVIYHYLTLNFQLNKEVLDLTDCLILSTSGMNQPGLVIVFVAVVNTLAADDLTELRGQLMTSDLSVLLNPRQWFESDIGDSDISKFQN